MRERHIMAWEISEVLDNPTMLNQRDCQGVIHLRAFVTGRALRVTINALTDCVLTVAEDVRHSCPSTYGWFSLGAAFQVQK